ncbi:MAG: hypothetical protein EBT26_09055, partial [Microbacteriaceae bacterium]|nr:hypothetical protein [Microbacteriaceae bacterium]
MTTGAVFTCLIDFSNGANFDPSLVLDDPSTPLDQSVLGTTASEIVDVSQYVLRTAIRRAYNRTSDSFTAGNAAVRLIDETGLFNPANTSSALYGKILPMRKIRFIGSFAGQDYALGSMYVQSWKYTSPTGFDPAFVDLNCVDGFQLLNLAGIAGQTTAERITSILDAAEWPGGMRSISTTADTTVQADTGSTRTALAACQTVEATDLGAFYMNQQGYATFKSRQDIIAASGGTATVFSDTGLPGTITYQKVAFDLSDFGLINSCTVTRTGGTPQTVNNVDSIDTFFKHSRNRSSIAQTDTDALNQALMIVASRQEVGADLRLESLTLDAYDGASPNRVTAALELDVYDPITVIQVLQGGNVESDTVITGVAYDITPNSFTTTFTTAQPFASGFVL